MSEAVDKIVEILNEALEADPDAINALMFGSRVYCNKALDEHPSIQVGAFRRGSVKKEGTKMTEEYAGDGTPEDEIVYKVGPLGLINGISKSYGYWIHACTEGGRIVEFRAQRVEADANDT